MGLLGAFIVVAIPLRKALDLIRDGRIDDSRTALGILYAAGFKAGN